MRDASRSELIVRCIIVESRVAGHDKDIAALCEALRTLTETPTEPIGGIGFRP